MFLNKPFLCDSKVFFLFQCTLLDDIRCRLLSCGDHLWRVVITGAFGKRRDALYPSNTDTTDGRFRSK